MQDSAVLYEKKESLGVITLNRAETGNAVHAQMAVELREIRELIYWDQEVKVVVLASRGSFCSGTDKGELVQYSDKKEVARRMGVSCFVYGMDRPTVAAVEGDAFGQGLELALACDLRVCSETASFAMSHITHGDIPWDGGTQRLPRLIGRGKAMELILTGRIVNAQEAYQMGLVNLLTPPAELMTVTMDLARQMASKGPTALRYAREAINNGMDLTLDQGLRLEADLYLLIHTTGDRTEGIKAFREKRQAIFEGK